MALIFFINKLKYYYLHFNYSNCIGIHESHIKNMTEFVNLNNRTLILGSRYLQIIIIIINMSCNINLYIFKLIKQSCVMYPSQFKNLIK